MPTDYYERPYEIVKDQISLMSARGDEALGQAGTAIEALSNIPSPLDGIQPLAPFKLPEDTTPPQPSPNEPDRPSYPPASEFHAPTFDDKQGLIDDLPTGDDVPPFVPPYTTIGNPQAPPPIDKSGLPSIPTIEDATFPTAPVLDNVELGNILQITIPTFEGLNLPKFTAVAPTFTALTPQSMIDWQEPSYQSQQLDAIKAVVARALMGGTGIPASIEQALFDRARGRVDADTRAKTDEAFATWAGRNFEMPPGMLVEQVNVAMEDGRLQVNTFARDILIQAATWEIENLRNAVTNGIALEGQAQQIFLAMADRIFQAAKYRVEADISIYNAQVSLFTALNSAFATAATVYEAEIRGELAKLEQLKAEIEAQQLIGTVNEQTVRIYVARLQGLTNLTELYKSQVQGASAFLEGQKNKVELYGQGIQAYAARVSADAKEFDAYKTEVEAEGLKVQMNESYARGFAAVVEGIKSKADIKIAAVHTRVDALNAGTAEFTAKVQGERARLETDAESVRSMAAIFTADIEKFRALITDNTEQKRLDITRMESIVRNSIAYYEIVVKEYDASLARLEQESQVRVHALETVAQVTSQIAAGAFAAMHVSAQMEGRADVSDSYSRTDRYNMGPLP